MNLGVKRSYLNMEARPNKDNSPKADGKQNNKTSEMIGIEQNKKGRKVGDK
jgi:hypothetical protein